MVLKHVEGEAETLSADCRVLARLPLSKDRLLKFLDTEQYSDVTLCTEGQGEVIRAHRIVLSAWSAPLCRVSTPLAIF